MLDLNNVATLRMIHMRGQEEGRKASWVQVKLDWSRRGVCVGGDSEVVDEEALPSWS